MAVAAAQSGMGRGYLFREVIVRSTKQCWLCAGPSRTRARVRRESTRTLPYTRFAEVHQCAPGGRLCRAASSLRDSIWVEFMMQFGLSDEDLELAKRIYAYSLMACAFCGSNSTPLLKCSLCGDVRYCIGTDCQHADLNKIPAAQQGEDAPGVIVEVFLGDRFR
jgi:hypothetical protein